MKVRYRVPLVILAIFLLAACQTSPSPVAVIVISYPSGALSLRVGRDEASRLTYGELPEGLFIDRDVFDIDELHEQLQGKLRDVVPSDEIPAGQTFGTVTLGYVDGSQENYFIYDGEFATQLLAKACSNAHFNEASNGELYQAACSELEP